MDANPRLQTRPVRTRMPYSCNINRGPAAIVEIGRLLKRTSRAATSRQRIEHERHEEEIMVTADIHHSAVSDPVHPAAGSAPTKVSSTRLHVCCTSYRSGASSARNERVCDRRGWLGGVWSGCRHKSFWRRLERSAIAELCDLPIEFSLPR